MASLAKESRKTVVAIVGTTGVGKSQLAIELALSLSGKLGSGQREDAAQAVSGRPTSAEIINADSMQVYRGLDIITNKATREERQQVPHHLMDFLDPGEEYRVDRFRKDAMQKVDEISERGALPILVGGTMYFVQHLLFPGKLVSAETDPTSSSGKANPKSIAELPQQLQDRVKQLPDSLIHLLFQLQDLPAISSPDEFPADFPIQQIPDGFRPPGELSAALHRILQSIDPAIAQRWHWRDIRKVRRSLEVALQTGMPHSEIMAQQKQVEPVAEYRTLILWLYSDPKILEPRLDGRVEKMLERGLLNELKEMREIAQKNQHVDMSKGIYQAIGYKEFSRYFDADNDKDTLFRAALEEMKLGTRQYSRKQVKWLRNQTVPAVKRVNDALSVPDMHIYVLDATDLGRWQVDVQDTAVRILRDFLEEREMPDPLETTEIASSLFVPPKAEGPRRKIACEVCSDQSGRPMMLEEGGQMEAHLRSWSHRKRLQKSGRVV